MHKILALSAVAAVFAGNALAQCSNYSNTPAGTLILQADDAIRTVALPFSFPFNGTLYTAITVSTNGWLKLGTTTNTANDLGESETLFLNNPITANNLNPRIAVCWDDLRPSGVGQGVYYASDPTQATICWVNAPAFSQATAFANCECILTVAGDIYLKYDSTCNYSTNTQTGCTPIVGISKSDGTVAVATHTFDWTLATPGPLSVVDATGYQQFTNSAGLSPWDLSNVIIHFTPTGASTYDVTNTTLSTCAPGVYPPLATASTSVGVGCGYGNQSIYELFTVDTGTNPKDFSGSSYTYVRSGSQYTVVPGPGIDLTYTSTGTIQAGMADDTAHVRTLAMGSFQFGGISTTQLTIISNGYINIGNSTTNTLNATAAAFHGLTQGRVAGCWKDLLPNTTTTPVYVDDTASMFRATWHNVPFFSGGGGVTMQITFDQATGNITVSYGSVTGSVTASPPLIGLAGPTAVDSGSVDMITGGVANVIGPRTFTGLSTIAAMSHTTSLAQIGLPFTMSTTCPSGALNVGFGSWLVGFSNPNVPVDLIFGAGQAPGCNIYSDFAQDLDLLFAFTAGASSFSKIIPVPANNALGGIIIFTQAACFVPSANPLGIITSNGRTQTVGI